jgi:hypothetical protein
VALDQMDFLFTPDDELVIADDPGRCRHRSVAEILDTAVARRGVRRIPIDQPEGAGRVRSAPPRAPRLFHFALEGRHQVSLFDLIHLAGRSARASFRRRLAG